MVDMLMTMASSIKPIVAVVRGGCYGISFTMLCHATFIYASPDAVFQTPFIKSSQSPEGTSTLMFPKIFGKNLTNEILLTDRPITAEEALKTGFANGIITDFDPKKEFFDPDIIPVIPKMLAADSTPLFQGMKVLNEAKDLKKIEEITKFEAKELMETWMDPEFLQKMMKYMK